MQGPPRVVVEYTQSSYLKESNCINLLTGTRMYLNRLGMGLVFYLFFPQKSVALFHNLLFFAAREVLSPVVYRVSQFEQVTSMRECEFETETSGSESWS